MKVYVIYDPLHEVVVCVHEDPEMDCNKCIGAYSELYGLEEHEHEVVPSKQTIRDNKLNQIL